MGKLSRFKGVSARWVFPLIAVIVLVVVGSSASEGVPKGGDEGENEISEHTGYAVASVQIPQSLYFAGERVPLEYFDVVESLDRELLSNTYFHSQTIRLIKLASRYFSEIEPILESEGVPDDFKYLAIAESGLANVVSPAGARGFWQIRMGTGLDYGLEIDKQVDERYHLEKATRVACRFLKESYEKYGNWTMSAASYNAGRKGMDRQIEKQKETDYYNLLLNEETARYIFRILAFKLILDDPQAYGFQISDEDLYQPIPYKTVTISTPVDNFADFAKENGTNYKMLKTLNPWLRENYLTNSKAKSYEIRIVQDR